MLLHAFVFAFFVLAGVHGIFRFIDETERRYKLVQEAAKDSPGDTARVASPSCDASAESRNQSLAADDEEDDDDDDGEDSSSSGGQSATSGNGIEEAKGDADSSSKKRPARVKRRIASKSLGILSAKFVDIFFRKRHTAAAGKSESESDSGERGMVSLEEATQVVLGQDAEVKARTRRLYDIANILVSVGLIVKVRSSCACCNGAKRDARSRSR